MKWISVDDALPEFKDSKILFKIGDDIKEGFYYNISYNGQSKDIFTLANTGSLTLFDTNIVKYWSKINE